MIVSSNSRLQTRNAFLTMCTVSSICRLSYYVCARDYVYVFMCELVSICILFHSSVLAVWWSLKHGNPGIISYPVPLWSTNGNPVSAQQRNWPHTNTHAHFTYSHGFLTRHMFLTKAHKITCTNAQILHKKINTHAVAHTHSYLHKHRHTYQIGRAVGGAFLHSGELESLLSKSGDFFLFIPHVLIIRVCISK